MIIVGVDGSRAGLEAAGWAAMEAALREVPLTVAHAMPGWVCEPQSGRYAAVAKWMRDGGAMVLAAAEDRARREQPKISIRTVLLPGDPRVALIKAAKEAELLVIGGHGIGGVRGLLVGSVAYGVAGHAPCDVVVVRQLPSAPRGELVAGVDGSSESRRRVLDFAIAEAELRGAGLRVVHAWRGFEAAEPQELSELSKDERGGRLVLRDVLAGYREEHPDVDVIEEAVRGHPVEVLRQAAEGADLLVVGSHGYGAFAGLVMGSVSQAMLHHSPCPLAVVRSRMRHP